MHLFVNFYTYYIIQETQAPETEEDEAATEDDPLIKVDVLGLLFIVFFLIILLLQVVGMIIHRWGTFLHLVSVTELRNPFKKVILFSLRKYT